ncbi:MAG: transketolase [Marinoscillum sp.]|nr:transketolase [Marinoscillum sp.]OUX26895.1 MAG: transketolase [Flammeovirgaceae bacterium TMED262]
MSRDIEDLKKISSQVRRDILRMVHKVQSGHPGGSLGCTDLLVSLFFNIMKRKEDFDMNGKNEDIFFLSNGHISPVFYSVLSRAGYFDLNELNTFRELNSRLQGHPATHEGLPGIRIASGSLGQGLSVSIGSAISKKLNNDKSSVYVLMGDGELQEGQIWEAAMFASHNKLNNLIGIIDYNGQQIDGPVNEINSLLNLEEKFKSFGWTTIKCDGHNYENLLKTFDDAKKKLRDNKPVIVIMKTIMGKGVDFMENSHKWHGIAPDDDQLKKALSQLEETLGDY